MARSAEGSRARSCTGRRHVQPRQVSKFFLQAIEAAGASLGVQAIAAPVRATADIELALESFARRPNGGLILTSDTFTTLRGPLIANLADRYRLPSIGSGANFTKDGGLMYNGTDIDLAGEYRRAATYARTVSGRRLGVGTFTPSLGLCRLRDGYISSRRRQ
jgi:hypothetical protein